MRFINNILQFLFVAILVIEIGLLPHTQVKEIDKISIRISGEIIPSSEMPDNIEIFQYNPITFKKSIVAYDTLEANNTFSIEFEALHPQFYYFAIGNNVTQCFLSPGDYLTLFVNANHFDESLTWFGSGDQINQFMVDFNNEFKNVKLSILQLAQTELDSLFNYYNKILERQIVFLNEKHEIANFKNRFYEKFRKKIYINWCSNIHEKGYQLSWISGELFSSDPSEIFLDTFTLSKDYPYEHPDFQRFLYIYLKHYAKKEDLPYWYKKPGPDKLFRYVTDAIAYEKFIKKTLNRNAYELIWGRYLFYSINTRKKLPETVYKQFIDSCKTKSNTTQIISKLISNNKNAIK